MNSRSNPTPGSDVEFAFIKELCNVKSKCQKKIAYCRRVGMAFDADGSMAKVRYNPTDAASFTMSRLIPPSRPVHHQVLGEIPAVVTKVCTTSIGGMGGCTATGVTEAACRPAAVAGSDPP